MPTAPSSSSAPLNGVALVGLSCQFPGAADHAAFWRNLRAGVESISFFDDETLRRAGCSAREIAAPNYVKAGGVLENIEAFDAGFFGYTPREAALMDPQFRLLLEHSWRAMEDAAHDPRRAPERVAVYAGMSMSGYLFHLLNQRSRDPSIDPLSTIITNDKDALATRIAYALDLRGPSLTVQTFCSTSLVCAHLAVQSILSGESDVALAAGASIKVPHISGYSRVQDSITSSDGHTRTFDAQSDGTLFSNGVGVVVLKALDLARRDGNRIYAVIRGSALNNDGANKVGYTAPGVHGQAAVMREALSNADVSPDTIAYVETHGTATRLGDATELNALKKVFKGRGRGVPTCGLGSVKTNIGHADVASGVAGLIKSALAVHHRELPPSLHCRAPNPELDPALFHVNSELVAWRSDQPLRVGVSSFGIGGTNAHLVLEAAPALAARAADPGPRLLVLSARSQRALDAAASNLRTFLLEHPSTDLTDVAHTLRIGRAEFNYRRTVVCRSHEEALAQLGDSAVAYVQKYHQPPTWLDCGPFGPGNHRLAAAAAAADPLFRQIADEHNRQLAPITGGALLAAPGSPSSPTAAVASDAWRSLLFPVLAWRTLQRTGVSAATALGRGSGKLTALVCADVVPVADAARIWAQALRTATPESAAFAARVAEVAPEFLGRVSRPKFALAGFDVPLTATQEQMAAAITAFLRGPDSTPSAPAPAVVTLGFGLAPREAGTLPRRIEVAERLATAGVPTLLAVAGDLWNLGVSIDWSKLNAAEHGRRIGLPTYPFERERHWIDQSTGAAPAQPTRCAASDQFYVPTWQRLPLTECRDSAPTPAVRVVIGGNRSATDELAGAFGPPDAARNISVNLGTTYEEHADGAFTVDPRDEAQLRRVIATLADRGTPALEWVWLNALPPAAATPPLDPVDLFFELSTLGKALAATRSRHPASLLVVTEGLQQVLGDEPVSLAPGTLPGLLRVLRTELPWLRPIHVDLAPGGGPAERRAAAGALLRELRAASPATAIAYRHGQRWIQSFERVRLPAAADRTLLQPNASYVITGGLGGLGFELARHLSTHHRARVTVFGRSPAAALSGTKAARWRELSQLAPPVAYREVEVTDPVAVRRAISDVVAASGPLQGVFHLAGVAGGGLLALRSREAAAAVIQPKVRGYQALVSALAEHPPAFLALFSSVTSLLGEPGQADYAAANSFLDTAATTTPAPYPVIAINWDTWAETGMAKETPVTPALEARRQRRLRLGLTSRDGLTALEQVLASGLNRVVVATTDFRPELTAPLDPTPTEAPVAAANRLPPRPNLSTAYTAPTTDAEQMVALLWQQLFGIGGLGADDDFFELGGHSLLAVQFLEQLRTRIPGLEISLSDVFARPTIRGLATAVAAATRPTPERPAQPEPVTFAADLRSTIESLLRQQAEPAASNAAVGINLAPIATDLAWQLKDRHRFPVYSHELQTYPSLDAAVAYFAAEHRLVTRPQELLPSTPIEYRGFDTAEAGRPKPAEPRLPAMAFLHSTPRAGSTIVRMMLAGNTRLFVPPELGLFNFATMAEWSRQAERGMVDGLANTFAAARGESRESGQARVAQLVAAATPTHEVYRELLASVSPRLLVEKTPGYGMQWPLLEAMESGIAGARYLHLVRHPCAVIESYVRNRFFRRTPSTEPDPYALAERMWVATNRSLDRLGTLVGPGRYLRVRYEDLVAQPAEFLPEVCSFLGVAFDPAMLDAYAGDRAIAGPGDPSIFTHRTVEAGLADAWKRAQLPRPMCSATRELASGYGYATATVPAEDAPALAEPSPEPGPDEAVERLLGKIDDLSAEEIDRALRELEHAAP